MAAKAGAWRRMPGDEAVSRLAPTATSLVVGVAEEVGAGARVGQAHVEMGARSPGLGIGLGHEGGQQARLLGHLLDHETEKREPVGHLQCRRVVEIELELPVAALVVKAEHPEAGLVHGLHHGVQEAHGVKRRLHVIGGGGSHRPRPGHGLEVGLAGAEGSLTT